ncbi:uroporphyrinogen-III C-methyltransferase [Ideonella livida]|uniref:Heme biosynthesis operon protein HemX n=1 Tax=Ideonella livida TaxID=2707176 RepID=A0A7C9PHV5_9BURK|nr:uroporphyrinogen-III C-methyltransferase [Ideonella livida]NDY91550.1 hypothetical protein [Ideonella livida]
MSEPTLPPTPASPEPAATSVPPVAPAAPLSPVAAQAPGLAGAPPAWHHRANIWVLGAVAVTAMGVLGVTLAWNTQQRVQLLEQELVRRQQVSQEQSTEARLLSRQAQEIAADAQAKVGLLEARVAESALQRSQVEELIQSLSRSRDENVLADVESALRVAQQQAAITGSADPVVAALRQADERLTRYNQPRLERVRRAVARDLDRARAVSAVDVPSLVIKLDEAVRLVDELPLLASAERAGRPTTAAAAVASRAASRPAAAASAPEEPAVWQRWVGQVWQEVKGLVRVTRIDHPEAALISPEQSFFLRENLKLRLLNARLALMSRQFDLAQSDLAQAQGALGRYFDPASRRVAAAQELVGQVGAQSRVVNLPRPDETLAALAAAAAGR